MQIRGAREAFAQTIINSTRSLFNPRISQKQEEDILFNLFPSNVHKPTLPVETTSKTGKRWCSKWMFYSNSISPSKKKADWFAEADFVFIVLSWMEKIYKIHFLWQMFHISISRKCLSFGWQFDQPTYPKKPRDHEMERYVIIPQRKSSSIMNEFRF